MPARLQIERDSIHWVILTTKNLARCEGTVSEVNKKSVIWIIYHRYVVSTRLESLPRISYDRVHLYLANSTKNHVDC